MIKKSHKPYVVCALLLVCSMVGSNFFSSVIATSQSTYGTGFDKGVSWKPYIPLKRTTFVQFDAESYLDDYAYLAAVPTSVFYNKNDDQLFTSPLLFYQDSIQNMKGEERSLNARQGIDYFMEDWMGYCNQDLNQLTLINVASEKLNDNWEADTITSIQENDPYTLANKIALHDWSYSENAVVATIEKEYEKPNNHTTGMMTGSLGMEQGVLTEHFEIPKTNQVYPEYNEFTVPEGYKFLKVRSWYPCFYFTAGKPGFQSIFNTSIPAGDRDLQIYCEKDGQWMLAGLTLAWNALEGMDFDKTSCYIYTSGKWSVALTDAPTKSLSQTSPYSSDDITILSDEVQKHHQLLGIGFGRYGRIIDIIRNMRQVTYQIDVELYPGMMVEIPQTPPFGCRNAKFEVTWDNPSTLLGFSVIGPSGEEVLSTRDPDVSPTCTDTDEFGLPIPSEQKTSMVIDQLGECLPGEYYSICVFSMNQMDDSTDFTVSYSWDQNMSRKQGDNLASATEGAVLASVLNAPLLYTKSSEVPTDTIQALYTLGVKNIYVVDLGSYLSLKAKTQLSEVTSIKNHFTIYEEVYKAIRGITQRNDVIFSTINPWKYWYTTNLTVAGELPAALPIGPAAYLAAIHGSPVLLIENHPELSSAVVWHNEFWRRNPDGLSKHPTVPEMYLTGTRVYDFLKAYGYDEETDETIITLGGQYTIGLTWERMFVGKAYPGRFFDSPTDISVWVAKTVFYPQIVFENPALENSNGVIMINGSSSERRFPWRGKFGLKITKPSEEITVQYPVLDTLICYDEKFNTRASTYWGFTYSCADGSIPGVSPSFEPIDDGVMVAVNGQEGAFFPDLSGPEVQPFYIKKAGYTPVFSTSFDANMQNLNNGVLLWMINTHGYSPDGGLLMFWDVNSSPRIPLAGYTKETNPWRSYEWLGGSTEEPDTMTMEVNGLLAALAGNPDPKGLRLFATGLDIALAKRPVRDIIGKISSLPLLRFFAPDWLEDTQDYYDGVVITVFLSRVGTSWYNGTTIDDALGNIHSAGVSSVACLPAGKYLHLALMRHGSVFQIMDPWATSWYSDVWQNGVPRGIALGKTIGEIYSEGISKVGILYISDPPQWWWDITENVCLYGDPDLRVWAPSTEYSTNNYWEKQDVEAFVYKADEQFIVNGHMPFGADEYSNTRSPSLLTGQMLWMAIVILLVVVIIIGVIVIRRRKH